MNESATPRGHAETEPELELPDAPDVVMSPPTMTFEEFLRWNEQARRWFAATMPTDEERLARKMDAEFRL